MAYLANDAVWGLVALLGLVPGFCGGFLACLICRRKKGGQ